MCSYRWMLSAAKHCRHKRNRYRSTPTGALNHPFMPCTAELTSFSVQSDSKPHAYKQGRALYLSAVHSSSCTDLNLLYSDHIPFFFSGHDASELQNFRFTSKTCPLHTPPSSSTVYSTQTPAKVSAVNCCQSSDHIV